MKYAIIGDIHGNLEAFQAVLEKVQELEIDTFISIGDIVGYNANPKECLDLFRTLNVVAGVRGNHDDYVSSGAATVGFNPDAAKAVVWTREQLNDDDLAYLANIPYHLTVRIPEFGYCDIVHATMDMPTRWGYITDRFSAEVSLECQNAPLCFFGHSHVPLAFEKLGRQIEGGKYDTIKLKPNRKYVINIGSIGQPRDGDPRASFAVFNTSDLTVTKYRVEYDVETAQKKILEAGLPPRLASRLAIGR